MQSDPDRRARGELKISEILGQNAEQVERSPGDIAPGLATYVLETIYRDIYQSSTPGPGKSSPLPPWRRWEPLRRNCAHISGRLAMWSHTRGIG